jgi:hypothetical protein
MTEEEITEEERLKYLRMREEKRLRNERILASNRRFDTSAIINMKRWCPLPNVIIKPDPPKLFDYTKKLIKSLTPKIPESWYKGGIKTRIGTIIGRMGYGKSETVKSIYKEIIKHYGEEKVNCIAGVHIKTLIDNFDDKPVQLLFLDDSTGLEKKEQKEMIRHIVRIRHRLKEAQKNREKKKIAGIIILIISSHSFFMLRKEIRTLFNFTIMKSFDSNAYNQRIMREEFGVFGVKELEKLTKRKEVDDDMSALNTSVISMIGQKKGGYLYFEYDPEEAEKECWRWIDYDIPEGDTKAERKEHTSKNTIKTYKKNTEWGDFYDKLLYFAKKEDMKAYEGYEIPSLANLVDCLHAWFSRYFLGLSNSEIEEEMGLAEETINTYCTRINNVMKSPIGDRIKPKVSEQWVVDSLNKLFPLFPATAGREPVAIWQCKECSEERKKEFPACRSKQHNDVCIHEKGKRILSINVKWKTDKPLGKTEGATPEYYSQPHAILFIDTRTGKGRGTRVRYRKLKSGQKNIKVKEITIAKKGDRGNILEVILEQL